MGGDQKKSAIDAGQPLMTTGTTEAGFDWSPGKNKSAAFESNHLRRNGLISRIGSDNISLSRNNLIGRGGNGSI
ncbi:hypothetical protein [Peribacillus glennii]|uniref:Uncharacterized protein n=1 Tax=Peribacillus glennii TaxID=2303991 RepID=A0A372L6U3_9BACI|nr:hypothetical protein [Peribacillus glennii]RFU60863.1 hypothetical protein D0466_19985 [Peribacillus glennii]